MAMNDVRLSFSLPAHPKTKKLIRRLGEGGAWHLVCLFMWAGQNRPDGDLSGLSDEDIEIAVDWKGEMGALVGALSAVGFLDGSEYVRVIHDWAVHNPWAAGFDLRSKKAKWNAVKKHRGEQMADEEVPEWAATRRKIPATSTDAAC